MLRATATVFHLGTIPRIGPLLATLAGLALALVVHGATGKLAPVLATWAFLLVLAAWIVELALRAGIPGEQIVIDRFAGIWLAAAPAIPLAGLLSGPHAGLAMVCALVPVLLYSALLAGPLRRMGRSPRLLLRFGDDLIAAGIAAIGTLAVMLVLLQSAQGASLR